MSAKHAALAYAVNQERDRRLAALVVTVAGVPYDGDPRSRENLVGILSASAAGVPVPWPLPWRCADNLVRPLGQADAVAVSAAIMAAIQTIYAASWHLKDTVIPALDIAGVQACDVTADTWWTP